MAGLAWPLRGDPVYERSCAIETRDVFVGKRAKKSVQNAFREFRQGYPRIHTTHTKCMDVRVSPTPTILAHLAMDGVRVYVPFD